MNESLGVEGCSEDVFVGAFVTQDKIARFLASATLKSSSQLPTVSPTNTSK